MASLKAPSPRRREFAIAGALLAAAVLAAWFVARPHRSAPIRHGAAAGDNVLLITIDTLRADRVGAYGNRSGLTPTLDRLAADGLRFDATFTPVPMTLPAHASILTGLEPFSHGVRNNTAFRLGDDTPTLASYLKQAGYATGAFVGAVVLSARFGLNRDFDVYDDHYGRGGQGADFRVAERRAERVIQPAADWILGLDLSRPWFAWIHLYDPHAPYQAPAEYAAGRAPYDAEIAYTDAMIGRGLDRLHAAGRLDRTIVAIVGDHGESLGEHGESTHGLFAYDATLRVPMIVTAPGLSGRVVRDPVATIDLAPTVLDLLGVSIPPALDGRSLLTANDDSARALYFEALDANLTRGWAPLVGVTAGGWKYIDLPIPELYDLRNDPQELHNVASREPERMRVLQARLKDVIGSRKAPPSAGRVVMDTDTAGRLASLGYIASTNGGEPRTFSASDDPKSLVALNETFYDAIRQQNDGRSEKALAELRDVVARRPDFLAARMSAAAILGGNGRASEAIALLLAAPGGSDSAAVQTELGLAYEAAGDLARAAACLERAAALRAGDFETLNSLGVVYARLRRFADGRRVFRQILESDPHASEVWNNLGTLELSAGNRVAAADAFHHAVAEDPGYAAAWQGLGTALITSDPAAAVDAWRRAVALAPHDFDTLFNLGLVLADGPHPQDALVYLQRFVAEAPRDRYARDIAQAGAIIARLTRD